VADFLRSKGVSIIQTRVTCNVRTTIKDAKQYLLQMKRWLLFSSIYLKEHLDWKVIILIVLLLPFTKTLVGSISGPQAAMPALILSAAPFYARLVEIGLREVDKGVIEAARAMGAKKITIVTKVLIPESLPAIVSGLTVTAIALVGSTAMAGVIGAGGLGNLAYLDGFQRNNNTLTFVATVLILVIVFGSKKYVAP